MDGTTLGQEASGKGVVRIKASDWVINMTGRKLVGNPEHCGELFHSFSAKPRGQWLRVDSRKRSAGFQPALLHGSAGRAPKPIGNRRSVPSGWAAAVFLNQPWVKLESSLDRLPYSHILTHT